MGNYYSRKGERKKKRKGIEERERNKKKKKKKTKANGGMYVRFCNQSQRGVCTEIIIPVKMKTKEASILLSK